MGKCMHEWGIFVNHRSGVTAFLCSQACKYNQIEAGHTQKEKHATLHPLLIRTHHSRKSTQNWSEWGGFPLFTIHMYCVVSQQMCIYNSHYTSNRIDKFCSGMLHPLTKRGFMLHKIIPNTMYKFCSHKSNQSLRTSLRVHRVRIATSHQSRTLLGQARSM